MQRINTAKSYSYHFYDAAVVDAGGAVKFSRRLVLASVAPLKIEVTKFDPREIPSYKATGTDAASEPMLAKVMTALGMDNLMTVTAAEGEIDIFYASDDFGSKPPFEAYASPMRVLSQRPDFVEYIEDVPKTIIENALANRSDKAPPLVWTEHEAVDLMSAGLEKTRKVAEEDTKRGYASAFTKAKDAHLAMGAAIMDLLKAKPEMELSDKLMGEALKTRNVIHGKELDGDAERYVPVDVTDFAKVTIESSGRERHAERLRLAHPEPPVWHPADDAQKAEGFLGYWLFPSAAIATGMPDRKTDTHMVVEYTGYRDLKVMVKDVDAINPAGQVALPAVVYTALTGKTPETTMDAEEAHRFTVSHSANSTQEAAITRN